jgi:diguanylate cyclase (GGDEF)-like protein
LSLLLGPPGLQRARTAMVLLALGVYVAFAVMQHVEVMFGLVDGAASWRLTAFTLSGALLLYVVVRSGLNLKLGLEPSLSIPGMLFAMVAVSWSYAITGPARGAIINIMMLILMYGTFVLSARQARLLAWAGLGMLGSVIVWKALSDPGHYDPRVEAIHFLSAVLVMGGAGVIAHRVGQLRRTLQRQSDELAEALERLRALATRDVLTGLLNRRAMLEALAQAASQAQRTGRPLAIGLIDLDHFKRVNDTLGHGMGDRVLLMFAQLAQAEWRAPDTLARWGGEEFLVALPDTELSEAARCLERLRPRLASAAIEGAPADLRITFSAGLTLCESEADVLPAIERADLAMYRAKAAGRNRTALEALLPIV